MKKDYEAVSEAYDIYGRKEFVIVHSINMYRPAIWIESGISFDVARNDQYKKYDINLSVVLPNRNYELISKIEYEYGAKQVDWDYELPWDKWVYGFNLLDRKKYDVNNFRFFIKSSPTFNSMVIIDTWNEEIKELIDKCDSNQIPNKVGFETNDTFYSIDEDDFKKNVFSSEKNRKGGICVIEYFNYEELYKFFWIKANIRENLAKWGLGDDEFNDIKENLSIIKTKKI